MGNALALIRVDPKAGTIVIVCLRRSSVSEGNRMPVFKLPLSGDVVQSIYPSFFSPTGGQFGLVNITVGQSSAPDVEKDVLSDVAGYGKQIGQIAEAQPRRGTIARARSYERVPMEIFRSMNSWCEGPLATEGF